MAILNKYVMPLIFSMALLVLTFAAGLELIIFNEPYFQWHYTHRNITETTEMSVDDLMVVTVTMLDYLKDEAQSLDMMATIDGQREEVFGEREKQHMVDVKNLYLDFRQLRRLCSALVIGLVIFGVLFGKRMLYHTLNRVKYIVPVLLLAVGAVGALFATDFNRYFTIFHELFFDNDLWLLNPQTDILINMVPEVYFYSIVMIGLGLFLLFIVMAMLFAEHGAKSLKKWA